GVGRGRAGLQTQRVAVVRLVVDEEERDGLAAAVPHVKRGVAREDRRRRGGEVVPRAHDRVDVPARDQRALRTDVVVLGGGDLGARALREVLQIRLDAVQRRLEV